MILPNSRSKLGFDIQFQQASNDCKDLVVVATITGMAITFDPLKRERALAERGLDFADAEIVFEGVTLEIEDTRKDYGEQRIICFGLLAGRRSSLDTRRVAWIVTSSA